MRIKRSSTRSGQVALAAALAAALMSGAISGTAAADVSNDMSSGARPASTPVGFEPGDGGLFRYATNLGVPGWDPAMEPRGFAPAYFNAAYDGLLLEKSDGSLEPGLATEWNVTDEAVTFTLREGVTFHDGTVFDAAAVAYNIERIQQVSNANAELLSTVTEVEVTGDHEVVFHLTERDPDLLNVLARMPGMMVSPNVAPDDIALGVPAGTGPYRVVEYTEDRTLLERNHDYWDPTQQYLDGIEFVVLTDDDARLNALLTDRVDAAMLSSAMAPAAESAGFSISEWMASVAFLTVVDVGGSKVPELGDQRVRQAIAHAIDREAWASAVGRGYGEPTFQFFQEGSPWHLDDWEGYDYDPERARELLAEAGVENVTLETHTWGPFLIGNQVLQQMYAEVGIELTINQIAPGGDVAAVSEGLVPVNYTLMSANHPETMWGQYFDADLARNAWGQVAPGAEETRAALVAVEPDGLEGAYQDMLRLIYEEAWGIPIWVNNALTGFNAERFSEVPGIQNVVLGVAFREMGPSA